MLPTLHRLPSLTIRMVMRGGKRLATEVLQASVTTSMSPTPWRCAIIVSTKVDKRAVVRNRIRRLIGETLRNLHPALPEGIDIVIMVKKGFRYETQDQANEQIRALLRSLFAHSSP